MKSSYADSATETESVTVRAPARLHLGFLDLNATQGRRFGSIGLAVNSHYTQIRLTPAAKFAVSGHNLSQETQARIEKLYQRFDQQFLKPGHADQHCHIHLDQAVPEHAGLGSGTQLTLTLGTALARWHKLSLSTTELAMKLGRGKRSGIGIATFDKGGFVIDGGLKPGQTVPPVLMQQAYPDNWRIVMIMDTRHQGIHGQHEKQAFSELPLFPLTQSQAICHLTLMQLLPALAEREIDVFGEAISEIQARIGDHFAAAQGGRYTSPMVADCLHEAQRLGHKGIAQSSWGPTGCAFVDSETQAKQLIQQLETFGRAQFGSNMPEFISAQPDNRGAIIETVS